MIYGFLTLVGLAAVVMGVGYGVFLAGGRVGPGFLPVVSGSIVAVLCGAILIGTVTGKSVGTYESLLTLAAEAALPDVDRVDAGQAAVPDDDIDITGRNTHQRVMNLWVVFGLTFAAIAGVQLVGFLAAFGLLVLVIAVAVEHQRPLPALFVTVLSVLVIYAVFGRFLGVPLPGGVLGLGTEG